MRSLYVIAAPRLFIISLLVALLSPVAWGGSESNQESQVRKAAYSELIAVTARLAPLLEALGDISVMSVGEYLARADDALEVIDTSIARLSGMQPETELLNYSIQYVRMSRDVIVYAKLGVGHFVDYADANKMLKAAELLSESPYESLRMDANLKKAQAYKRLAHMWDSQANIRLKFRVALSDLRHAALDLEGSPPGAVIDSDVITRADDK